MSSHPRLRSGFTALATILRLPFYVSRYWTPIPRVTLGSLDMECTHRLQCNYYRGKSDFTFGVSDATTWDRTGIGFTSGSPFSATISPLNEKTALLSGFPQP